MRIERIGITAAVALVLAAGAAAWWGTGGGVGGLERALSVARAQPALSVGEGRRNAIVTAAERVGPSVVSVNVVATQVVRERSAFDDPFFRGLFPPRERLRQVQNLGSGFIVSEDGYIVTNQHVVDGATEIVVTLLDGRQLPAEIVAADAATDLAVLRVEADDLPVAPLGDSDDLLIGEWAIAIGNPFGYLLADRNPSVTVGVISAVGRDVQPDERNGQAQVWSNMIQTDASINPGNSGGPLVNAHGEVIGVNAFIFSGGTGGSIGLGFAIPINRARRALSDVVEYGTIRRPWTGLHVGVLPAVGGQASRGARVIAVDPGSPAEAAGVRPGDVIRATDGRPLQSPIEWEGRLLDLPTGTSIELAIERAGQTVEIALSPAEDPLTTAPRIETPFGAEIVVVDATLASRLGLRGPSGLYLASVALDSGFRRLGLREGDVLLALSERRLDTADDVDVLVATLGSGRPFVLYAERDGVTQRFCYRTAC